MNPGNEALIDSWRLSLHEKRPRTIDLYTSEVARFARWLEDNGHTGDLAAVTKADVLRWINDLKTAGRAGNTIRNRWVCLVSFYGWAFAESEVAANPMTGVSVAKPHPPAPDVLTDVELRLLLKACEGTGFNERRDNAITRTLLSTGLRVSELVALDLADLDLTRRIAAVRDGKGGYARVVKFDPGTAAALDRYKRSRARHRCSGSPRLWIGHRGAMSRKGVPELLARRSATAGIRRVHPHLLRHTWAHRWLKAGGNEGDLQKLGGWQGPEVMRRYGEAQAVERALGAYDTIDPMQGL